MARTPSLSPCRRDSARSPSRLSRCVPALYATGRRRDAAASGGHAGVATLRHWPIVRHRIAPFDYGHTAKGLAVTATTSSPGGDLHFMPKSAWATGHHGASAHASWMMRDSAQRTRQRAAEVWTHWYSHCHGFSDPVQLFGLANYAAITLRSLKRSARSSNSDDVAGATFMGSRQSSLLQCNNSHHRWY